MITTMKNNGGGAQKHAKFLQKFEEVAVEKLLALRRNLLFQARVVIAFALTRRGGPKYISLSQTFRILLLSAMVAGSSTAAATADL